MRDTAREWTASVRGAMRSILSGTLTSSRCGPYVIEKGFGNTVELSFAAAEALLIDDEQTQEPTR